MFHPAAVIFARAHARQELRKGGLSFVQALDESRAISLQDLDDAALAVGAALPVGVAALELGAAVTGLGDGTIIQAIIDFFRSPTGQMILSIIVKAILAAFGL